MDEGGKGFLFYLSIYSVQGEKNSLLEKIEQMGKLFLSLTSLFVFPPSLAHFNLEYSMHIVV